MSLSARGVALSLGASCLFVLIPPYVRVLQPLDGLQVFAQRVLWSIPVILLLMCLTRQVPLLLQALRRLRSEPRLALALPLAAALMGVQWALFVWAPLAGRMLDVSLGYFLLPLVMVLVGRLFYGERLRPLLRLAVVCAAVGVAHEWWYSGAFSWVTLLAALGYPPYFMLRRWMRLDAFSGFILEMLVLAPLAVYLVLAYGPSPLFSQAPQLLWLLPGLALLSALAFAAMMASSRLVPLGLFGILSYLEPLLWFLVALFWLDEACSAGPWLTYLPIGLASALTVCDSVRLLWRQR